MKALFFSSLRSCLLKLQGHTQHRVTGMIEGSPLLQCASVSLAIFSKGRLPCLLAYILHHSMNSVFALRTDQLPFPVIVSIGFYYGCRSKELASGEWLDLPCFSADRNFSWCQVPKLQVDTWRWDSERTMCPVCDLFQARIQQLEQLVEAMRFTDREAPSDRFCCTKAGIEGIQC